MIDSTTDSNTGDHDENREDSTQSLKKSPDVIKKKRANMHDGIAVWCDCCSCEAEPYWVEVAEEMGIDLGSDYEDDS